MFDQNWLKRYMLANQAKGGAKKPPDPFDESPALHARQGLGKAPGQVQAIQKCPRCGKVCQADAPMCWQCTQADPDTGQFLAGVWELMLLHFKKRLKATNVQNHRPSEVAWT
ncbi:unnamed protein product [Effrenium voratum]|uniref:Uncharacterized protein n=1 Tax=Effrenium voratum TaxID=2562239 RepID=A0AA36NEQ5_9DINO|nr:unnamed protein product [Effrenium voratum]